VANEAAAAIVRVAVVSVRGDSEPSVNQLQASVPA